MIALRVFAAVRRMFSGAPGTVDRKLKLPFGGIPFRHRAFPGLRDRTPRAMATDEGRASIMPVLSNNGEIICYASCMGNARTPFVQKNWGYGSCGVTIEAAETNRPPP